MRSAEVRIKTWEANYTYINSFSKCVNLKRKEVSMSTDLEKCSAELLCEVENTGREMNEYYVRLCEEAGSPEVKKETEEKLASVKRASANILKAYQQSVVMHDELRSRQKDLRWRFKRRLSVAPANSVIDLHEKRLNHFAQGLNVYKLLLICFIGSFAGVVIELIWQFAHNGTLESRSGLVYGPFNLLYGIGALALTVLLYRFRNHNGWLSFLGGMIVGSAVEYICSWAQELAFGSRSWDYSHMPYNLNGRICLTYAFYWGILGYLWIKHIYPPVAALILKIPEKAGKIATWTLLAFFVVNSVVTCVSIYRWTQRMDGVSAPNSFWESIDDRFPDERMKRVFANMDFGKDSNAEQ